MKTYRITSWHGANTIVWVDDYDVVTASNPPGYAGRNWNAVAGAFEQMTGYTITEITNKERESKNETSGV